MMDVLNLTLAQTWAVDTCPTVHPKTPPTRNKFYSWYVYEINHRRSIKAWADAMYRQVERDSFFNKFYKDEIGAYAGIKIKGEHHHGNY